MCYVCKLRTEIIVLVYVGGQYFSSACLLNIVHYISPFLSHSLTHSEEEKCILMKLSVASNPSITEAQTTPLVSCSADFFDVFQSSQSSLTAGCSVVRNPRVSRPVHSDDLEEVELHKIRCEVCAKRPGVIIVRGVLDLHFVLHHVLLLLTCVTGFYFLTILKVVALKMVMVNLNPVLTHPGC